MERKTWPKFSADFKTTVVIEVLNERSTVNVLANKFLPYA